ncbi:hypothetical protein H4R21_002261 [Coemansia helicoidea]|uniref:Uncharacterized protein n=1 Tax=Coemansia helicoidea TaxID=1286919 RepID=A0ACC1L970_9FUNG|nr:hypothetical protein H4R21_002261 [Coemansia helicoidea]
MLLDDLPEGILATVLGMCVDYRCSWAYEFRRSLLLLAVCQKWRRLAIPLVYNLVYVKYGGRPRRRTGQFARDAKAEEAAGVSVTTNLDLIAMVGCASVVKDVTIDVRYLATPFSEWREVIQRMRAVAGEWRVTKLAVAMYPDIVHYDDRNVDMAKYADDVASVSDALAALMPDVFGLRLDWNCNNQIASSLYGRLVGHYADQLLQLNSPNSIVVEPDRQLTTLQNVWMSCNNDASYHFPRMASGELIGMTLNSGSSNHSWLPFSTSSDSRVIEFTKLIKLKVEYHTTYREGGVAVHHRDGSPWELQFPSIKCLSIDSTQSTCPLLKYAVLPPRVESIYLCMRSDAYLDIADVELPATRHLYLAIAESSFGDPRGLFAINRIMENARGSESLELRIRDVGLAMEPDSITCTALTHLSISAPTSVDSMLAFIGRLTNLIGLTICDLDLGDIRTDMSLPAADDDAVVVPYNTPLKELTINYDGSQHSPGAAVAVAKHVLLRVLALTKLHAAQIPMSPMLDFVEAYAPRYPHLRGTEMKLYKDRDARKMK